jgi:phage shock protein C
MTNPLAPNPPKRLLRSRSNRILLGVCGGIAEYLDLDPTLVRVLYVIISIVSVAFPGIIAYILLALIMPNPPE